MRSATERQGITKSMVTRREVIGGLIGAAAAAVLPFPAEAKPAFKPIWLNQYTYYAPDMKKTVDWGVLVYTTHPYVIGRGQRMLAFEELVDRLARDGAVFMTMEAAAREAADRLGQTK